MFPKKLRLRIKFTVLFVSLALLPLLLGMLITIIDMQNIEKTGALRFSEQVARTVSEKVKSFIESQFGVLEHISTNPEIFEEKKQTTILERTLFKNINFTDIAIVNVAGREIARSNNLRVVTKDQLRDRSRSPEFEAVKHLRRYLSQPYLSEGKPFFIIGVPAFGDNKEFIGAIFGIVDARVLQDVVKNISSSSKTSREYILDENNIVIAHPDISQVLLQKDFSLVEVVSAIINNKNAPLLDTYKNELNQDVLAAGVTIDLPFEYLRQAILQTKWVVIAEQTAPVALAAVHQVTVFTIITTLLVLIVAIFIALVVTNKIAGPIEQVHKAAEQIAAGNLEFRVFVNTGDEIEDLAVQFNSMSSLIEKQIKDLQKTDKLKDEFIALVSHNLRTPLTAIKGYISVIKKASVSEEEKGQIMTKMSMSTDSLDRLVDEILYISSAGSDSFNLDYQQTDICQLINKAVYANDFIVKSKNINIAINCQQNLPAIFMNTNRIHEVLVNLLDNAVKFSQEYSTIEFNSWVEGDYLITSVKDHGEGIDESVLPTLFEKFHRGTDYMQYNYKGIGLGLYFCKIVAEMHGGRIWVESKKGIGSTFFFSLPIKHKVLTG